MNSGFLFGISLTGSFLAGNLALFAPCCITFLLPSYLGTIFKKTEKVFFYTLIFSLGLSTVLVPVALGFKFIVSLFDSLHQTVYYFGGAVLILMGIVTFFEIKMPFSFSLTQKPKEKVDIASIYILGVVSGLTSSCCAPVLFAAITLTSLSPSLLQAFFVSLAYVLGIVFPLFLLSFFYDRISTQVVSRVKKNIYPIFKFVGAAIFVLSGIIIIILNYQGKIVMGSVSQTASIRGAVAGLSRLFSNPIVDIATFVLILYIFFKLLRREKAAVFVDPICGMRIDVKQAVYKKKVDGKTYYFCSKRCQDKFNSDS